MVYQKPNPDDLLTGRMGPAFWGFGKQVVVGQYIEGYLREKDSRHKQKYQTKAQRDAGSAPEYEYFKGKGKVSSSDNPEEYLSRNPELRPIWEFVTILQTQLRDPAKEDDDGLRTFAWPWRAQQQLAEETKRQGISGGLPIDTFIRVTLTALIPVDGLDTPKREYKVEIWAPGEQPTPSPAQPVVQAAPAPAAQGWPQQAPQGYPQQAQAAPQGWPQQQYQAPAAPQGWPQTPVQAPAQPAFQAPAAQAAPQFQAYPPEMLQMLKEQNLPHPQGIPWDQVQI